MTYEGEFRLTASSDIPEFVSLSSLVELVIRLGLKLQLHKMELPRKNFLKAYHEHNHIVSLPQLLGSGLLLRDMTRAPSNASMIQ